MYIYYVYILCTYTNICIYIYVFIMYTHTQTHTYIDTDVDPCYTLPTHIQTSIPCKLALCSISIERERATEREGERDTHRVG